MNLTRRAILGVVKYPNILDLSSPQYAQLPHTENADPRYVKISDWKPGKGLFRDDVTMFDWLLQNLSENDRTLFGLFQKCGQIPPSFKNTILNRLDCSIMELADDIAYGVHDLEDAIVTGVVNQHQWQEALAELKAIPSDWLAKNIEQVSQRLFSNHHSSVKMPLVH